jgi:hypothetical protein
MGLLRWMRGDEKSGTAGAMSAALGVLDEAFHPSRHKQMELIEEQKERKHDVANGADVDLDRGVIVLRRPKPAAEPASSVTAGVGLDEGADRVGDELNGDRGQQ